MEREAETGMACGKIAECSCLVGVTFVLSKCSKRTQKESYWHTTADVGWAKEGEMLDGLHGETAEW